MPYNPACRKCLSGTTPSSLPCLSPCALRKGVLRVSSPWDLCEVQSARRGGLRICGPGRVKGSGRPTGGSGVRAGFGVARWAVRRPQAWLQSGVTASSLPSHRRASSCSALQGKDKQRH